MDWVNTSPLVKRYTFEEFCELPEPPDHSKVELIGGVLYLTPRPDLSHGTVVSRLVKVITEHCLKINDKGLLYLPRAGIQGENTWLEPDFFYLSDNTEARLDGRYHTTADLVVEVMSVESAVYDRNTKADTYVALKVKELWLVDLSLGTVEIRVLEDIQKSNLFGLNDRFESTVVPDFNCSVRQIFGD